MFGFENFNAKKSKSKAPNEDSVFMLSSEFPHEDLDYCEERGIHKLFEDPEEKMEKIKASIGRS